MAVYPESLRLYESLLAFLAQHWMQALTSILLFLATYGWVKRVYVAPCAPSAIFVPSTSTYPSKAYTVRRKIPVQQFIDDFIRGRIELRDAQSGQGMEHIASVVSFKCNLTLAWRAIRMFLGTSHSERRDRENVEQFVLKNDTLLEEILGPDRLPLVGYIRDDMPEQLELTLGVQMERVGKEYLDLSPSDRLLDVNAQWGDLAVYLAHEYHVPTCAIVATSSQLAHATNLTGESQAQRFLRFVTGDYRAIGQCLPPGIPPFTKAVAFDVLDTIGPRDIPIFLRAMNDALECGGRLLLQVTTTPSSLGYKSPSHPPSQHHHQRPLSSADTGGPMNAASVSRAEPYSGRRASAPPLRTEQSFTDGEGVLKLRGEEEWAEHWWYHWFRLRYIHPGSEASAFVSIEQVMAELQRAGFEVLQVESLTTDAALTTAIWCNRLCAAKRQIEMELGEEAYRVWELYLNWSQSLYARSRIYKHFVLAVKRS
ncbi:hypothetical protein GGI12_000571 [Dipsacomyces acuminosporus]|nr:hypothetical protein GGI12_000571 [Dipsacomyces acuminosporus]